MKEETQLTLALQCSALLCFVLERGDILTVSSQSGAQQEDLVVGDPA